MKKSAIKLYLFQITSKQPDFRQGTYNGDSTRQWIEMSLHLQSSHYVNGQLNLRCTAEIPGIYIQSSEVQLGAGLREPVPERGKQKFSKD